MKRQFAAFRRQARRTSMALAFTGAAAIVLLISSAQSSWASDSDDELDSNKSPNDGADPHRFDISAMDRTELTRAFAGQLTVLPDAPAAQTRNEIVFIDPGVPEHEKLVHSIGKKVRVIELAPDRDGLAQIAAALAGERNIGAVHIISHGGEARIKLVGSADISLEALPEHLDQLKAIHNAMARDGDVLLYGCDIAKGDDGKLFVQLLSKLTGENVAASENLTGAPSRGGDWTLEFQAGTVHTQTLAPDASENYDAVLANFTVTNTSDPAVATSGDGSLRGELIAATAAGGGTIVFSGIPNNSTITLTTTGDTTAGSSAFGITNAVTIDGGGAPGLALSGSGARRIFLISTTGNLSLTHLTLINGAATGTSGGAGMGIGIDSGGGGGGSAGLGGAILNLGGTLNMSGCTLTANAATGGAGGAAGGVYGAVGSGGGGGGLNAAGGTGSGNNGGTGGGPNGGAAGIDTGPVAGGPAGFGGGGGGGAGGAPSNYGGFGGFGGGGGAGGENGFIGGGGGSGGFGGGGAGGGHGITVNGSGGAGGYGGGNCPIFPTTLSALSGAGGAGMGGAVFMNGGNLTATDCTITGNSAIGGASGGVGPTAGKGFGGGIFNRNGSCTILNCTIDDNTAADGGGGIFNLADAGPPTGSGSTATIQMDNTIVANSTSLQDFTAKNNGGTNTAIGVGNLIGSQSGFTGTVVSTANPLLSALANNGGPTQTMALSAGSPAIDLGDNTAASALTIDQRGFARVFNSTVDIGAFEFSPAPTLTAVSPGNGPVAGGSSVTLTGTNFVVGPTTVNFGSNAATNVVVNSTTSITCTSPAAIAGTVDITVTTAGGTTATSAADQFTCVKINLAPASLPAIQFGAAYNQTITAGGGTAPYTFSVSSGALPAGLALTSNGNLNGTLTAAVSFNFTVKATDSSTGGGPFSGTLSYTLTVNAPPAPTIISAPAATPNPAIVSQSIQFSAAATGTGTLTFNWDFGDGATATGSTVTHAYSMTGVFSTTLTVNDAFGGSVAASISVTVIPLDADPTGDANGDGFPNDFEAAFGLDPLAVNSTPFGETLAATADQTSLKPGKISIKLSFKKADTISVSGTLPIASGFKPNGKNVAVFISGPLAQYKLNAKGAATGQSSFKLTTKIGKDGSAAGGLAVKFTAKFAKGDYATPLAPAGFNNLTSFSKSLPVRILVYIDNHLYVGNANVLYKVKKGSSGSAK